MDTFAREKTVKRKVKKSKQDKIFDVIVYSVAICLIIITLYPMYFVLIASISNPTEVSLGNIIFVPKGLNVRGYSKLLEFPTIWTGYKNTIIYTILGTAFSLFFNIPTAYALSRKELYGRRMLTIFYMIPMFFTGGLIPTYLLVKNIGLLDTRWVLVFPFAVSTYYIIVARTFFTNSIPEELRDAAQLDGCGNLSYFFQIVLPLSKAVIAVIALWTAVGQWNSYFNALIYIRNDELIPMQLVLRSILINSQLVAEGDPEQIREAQELAELLKYSCVVVSSAPIMCMYPFVQKYFNQGVMVGSVKG